MQITSSLFVVDKLGYCWDIATKLALMIAVSTDLAEIHCLGIEREELIC